MVGHISTFPDFIHFDGQICFGHFKMLLYTLSLFDQYGRTYFYVPGFYSFWRPNSLRTFQNKTVQIERRHRHFWRELKKNWQTAVTTTVGQRFLAEYLFKKKMGNKLLCTSSCTNQEKNWNFGSDFCHYLYVLQKGPQNITFLSISFPPKWRCLLSICTVLYDTSIYALKKGYYNS